MLLTKEQEKVQIAKWIHRNFTVTGRLDRFREVLMNDYAGHGETFDFCSKHGSLENGPCSCEQTNRPSDTIRRNAPIHFSLKLVHKSGKKVSVDGCGQVPTPYYTVAHPILDDEGNRVVVNGLVKNNYETVYYDHNPSTMDITKVTCGNCIRRLRSALKYHDKMEAKAKAVPATN